MLYDNGKFNVQENFLKLINVEKVAKRIENKI